MRRCDCTLSVGVCDRVQQMAARWIWVALDNYGLVLIHQPSKEIDWTMGHHRMLIDTNLGDHINLGGVFRVLLVLAAANSAPVLAKKLFGKSLSYPVDTGFAFIDGRPIFGPSKTIRGLVFAAAASALCAVVLGFAWTTGLEMGLLAMAGDLISSFIKRRIGLTPSSMAVGLDQIPESLLPALAVMRTLGAHSWRRGAYRCAVSRR